MHPRPKLYRCPLQFPHRPQYPLPHRVAVQVASLKHGDRTPCGLYWRVLAVALHEEFGGALDVEVGD